MTTWTWNWWRIWDAGARIIRHGIGVDFRILHQIQEEIDRLAFVNRTPAEYLRGSHILKMSASLTNEAYATATDEFYRNLNNSN